MDLKYLKDLKKLENEFASSQRTAFACVDIDELNSYVCLNIFDNLESLEIQDRNFEITRSIMKKKKLGSALTSICSSFNRIHEILYKYIDLCNNLKFNNSDMLIKTKIITPLFLDLGNENEYFNILKNFEYKEFEKELKLFQKRKSNILNFKGDIFQNSTKEMDNILKEYFENINLKTFTIDYLKAYILEIKQIIKLINIYFGINSNSIYNEFNEKQKLFLFSILENLSNEFLYPISKIETKIKIENEYINAWNFRGKYLLKNYSNNKEKNKNILLKYIKENDINIFLTYRISTIKDLLYISLMEIFKNKVTIRKCKNCGQYFITENRTDEVYCNKKSPQNPLKTCKQYGAKRTYKEQIKERPIDKEHIKTSQFLRMRYKRSKNTKEKNMYKAMLEKYLNNFKIKKEQYKSGKLKENDFVEWIIKQKEGVKNGSTRNNKK